MDIYLHVIFIAAIAWEIIYHWCFLSGLLFHRARAPEVKTEGVSIVIAARNEYENLSRLIPSLLQQVYDDFEIIIVNDRSTDASLALLNEWQDKSPRLSVIDIQILPEGWTGKKHAVQQGITAAKKPIILLTDADCLPSSKQWVSLVASTYTPSTDFVLGFSPYEKKPGLLNQFIQYETLLTGIQYLSAAMAGKPYMGVGRNLSYRREKFLDHGFAGDEKYVGGDDDIFVNRLAHKNNTKVILSPASQVLSKPKERWSDYFIQKIRHLSAGRRYHKKDQTRLGSFSLSSWVGWLLFLYLLLSNQIVDWILVLFICRSLSFYSIFTLSGQKLNIKLAYWALPLFDLCYTIVYPVAGLMALTAKRIKWN